MTNRLTWQANNKNHQKAIVMKNKLIIKACLTLALLPALQKLQAQDHRLKLDLNYQVSQPFGSLHDYVNKTSFNGWNGALMYDINPNWSGGLSIGFQDYYQKIPRQVYHSGTTDISAVQTHTLQSIPVEATGRYTWRAAQPGIHPYAGLGIGIADINYEKYWGEFVDQYNTVHFSVSPMAGLLIPISERSPVDVNIGVRYNYVPYSNNEVGNLSALHGNIGLQIGLH